MDGRNNILCDENEELKEDIREEQLVTEFRMQKTEQDAKHLTK